MDTPWTVLKLWGIVSVLIFVLYWSACRLGERADRISGTLPANERYAEWDSIRNREEEMNGHVESDSVVVETKSIAASRTFWINAITITLAVLALTSYDVLGVNPAHIAWVSGVLNIFLRFLTNQPVSLAGSDVVEVKKN